MHKTNTQNYKATQTGPHLKPNGKVLVVQSAEIALVPDLTAIDLAAGWALSGQPGDPKSRFNQKILAWRV